MAAETARRWDPEFAAFYDRLRKKGRHHIEAICALGNKMAGRIYAVLKRLQMGENADPNELEYKIRDLDGNIVSKKKARKIILEKFPSKAEQEKTEKRNKKERRKIANKIKREKLHSQTAISRQSPNNQTGINSSQNRSNLLPAKTILENILSGAYLQDPTLDENQKEMFSKLVSMWESAPVDKLCIKEGNSFEKST